VAVDQAITACEGDVRAALTAMIVAYEFLRTEVKQLRASTSNGYTRGALPRERKDWYD
jgi:hypothetical protein